MIRKLILSSAIIASLSASYVQAQTIVGLTTTNQLTTFNVATPGTLSATINVTGVDAGQTLVGMDFRPNTGQLYALGYDNTTNSARLYTINYATGVATGIGTAVTLGLGAGSVGFDFNPTVDRIRVVGANGANYRLHPVTGAIAFTDGNLAYAAGDVNELATATIGAVAYTNSYIGAETTTLYDVDEALDALSIQNPPNSGTLNTVGSLGVNVSDIDIHFDSTTQTNTAYLAANLGGIEGLYTLNLTTAATTLVGTIGMGVTPMKDIAVVINRNAPPMVGTMMYGLTRATRNLITFDSENPQYIRTLMPTTGITMGQVIVGMDVRPATLQLYALGYNSTNDEYQVYTVDPTTAVLTSVAAPGTMALGTGRVGFDFNPTVDRIRVTSSNGANYRVHPVTGAVAATDTMLAYATGDVSFGMMPNVGSVAYTNSYMGTTSTMLFAMDDTLGSLLSVPAPNSGMLTTLNANLFTLNMTDLTTDIDFYFDSTGAGSNIGYVSANGAGTNNDMLYKMTTIGTPIMNGSIGFGIGVLDIAAQLLYTGVTPLNITNVNAVANTFAVYPNPATDVLNIQLETAINKVDLMITDMVGKQVMSQPLQNNTVSVNALPVGIYIIHLAADGVNYAPVKFVKK